MRNQYTVLQESYEKVLNSSNNENAGRLNPAILDSFLEEIYNAKTADEFEDVVKRYSYKAYKNISSEIDLYSYDSEGGNILKRIFSKFNERLSNISGISSMLCIALDEYSAYMNYKSMRDASKSFVSHAKLEAEKSFKKWRHKYELWLKINKEIYGDNPGVNIDI